MITRRNFLKSTSLSAASFLFAGCATKFSPQPAARPNILLIMADDMGYSDLGCYGGEINTPNIDRLAANGLRFTRFYNTARCCPTRASLLTGLYPHQAGMGGMVNYGADIGQSGPYQGYLNDRCVTISEVLKPAGYSTYMSGKWHVGESRPHWPTDRGFDKYFGLISGAANYYNIAKSKQEGLVRQMAIDDKPWKPGKDFYMTDAITDNALKFLDTHNQKTNPFFLYLAYTAPHWPLHAPEEYINKYRSKFMAGWDKLRDQRLQRQIKVGLFPKNTKLSDRDPDVPDWDSIEEKKQFDLKMAVYAAQLEIMDEGIGKVIQKLKENKVFEKTLIIFLSDNGGCSEGELNGLDFRENGLPPGGEDSFMSYGRGWSNLSNTPFRLHKRWVHEGGIATPLIAHWPGIIKPNTITHQIGHVMDIMPTLMEIANASYPAVHNGKKIISVEGISLVPILKGRKRHDHKILCWEHEGNRAIRMGKYKLAAEKNGPWQLFDIEYDRTEINDLASSHPELVADLEKSYNDWAARVGVEPQHQ